MQRKIKFRAWDKKRGVMIGSDYKNNYNTNNNEEWYSDNDCICLEAIEEAAKNENLELMQFTGLKDRNEKDIYEGDILEQKTPFFHKVFQVKWSNKKCGFTIKPKYLDEISVIGNIFENPELLK